MDRKAIAKETLQILKQGYYEYEGRRVEIAEAHARSVADSRLIAPEDWAEFSVPAERAAQTALTAGNQPTIEAIRTFTAQGLPKIGVLNFASAKNPGGGFINGAMAQEESLAASGGLYGTLTVHPQYYERNRACASMTYTDHAIYSPNVVFFRDGRFRLLETPIAASVLTLPAVNFGQVLQKGEDQNDAAARMRDRMRLALLAFAVQGDRNLVLGAYGCGVFRNDPELVAARWDELLAGEFAGVFERVTFAVLDSSKGQNCIAPFEARFGGLDNGSIKA